MSPHIRLSEEAQSSSQTTDKITPQEAEAAAKLQHARSADTAWRAERSRTYQKRIDRAHGWETKGHHWFHTPEEGMWYVILGTVAVGIWFGANNPNHWDMVSFGVLLALRPAVGACFYGSARLARRLGLRSARRANVEVTDPGNIPLFGPGLPDPPNTPV